MCCEYYFFGLILTIGSFTSYSLTVSFMNRKEVFANDEYYHIFNRGVDKRTVFEDDDDRYRFLHGLYEFNDKNVTAPFIQRIGKQLAVATYKTLRQKLSEEKNAKREKLVEILCFCFMPNHFHLILKQLQEGGISKFMQKLGTGYTNYFNLKNERKGCLFQGVFKSVYIKDDTQIMHLSRYIHILNPGELVELQIREGIIKNHMGLQDFLKNYKWSSYQDYIGGDNYPSLINKELLSGYFGGATAFEKFSLGWKNDDFSYINDVILE